jgi:hypothetical protein
MMGAAGKTIQDYECAEVRRITNASGGAGSVWFSKPLDAAARKRSPEQPGGMSFNRLQHLLGMDPVIRNGHSRNDCALPGIEVIDLGYRDVEAVTQTVFETLNDVALLFQRMRALHVYFKRKYADRGQGAY